jgi:DNA-binding response OmpR family regulator
MSNCETRPLLMLLVEDNPADVLFLREAVEAAGITATLEVVSNGEDALRFLLRQPPFADAPRPDVLVMDLNVPMKNGKELLADMMVEPALRTIPVAILTTSGSEAHLCESYTPGRCLYFTKTAEFQQLQDRVRQIAAHARAADGEAERQRS